MSLTKKAARCDPSEAFRQLSDPDPAIRLLGAKWVAKQAYGEVNRFTEPWLKERSTMSRLLPLLEDPAPLVVEQIVGAVMMIVSRYRKDNRPQSRAVDLLRSERANRRRFAAMLLTQLDDERLIDPLLALFNDRDKSVRAAVIEEIAEPASRWPAALRERVRQATLARLQDRTMDVRCSAARLLTHVGRREDVQILKRGLKQIKGFNYRQDYHESIKELERARRRKL